MTSEWLEVTKINGDSNSKCKNCDLSLSCKIEKIKAHPKKCPAKKMLSKSKNEESFSEILTSEEMETTTILSTFSSIKRMQCSLITDYVVETTEEQKQRIDQAVSMFFYATNKPFYKAELDNFKGMIEKLRPGYKPPSAKDISGILLDAAVNEVE